MCSIYGIVYYKKVPNSVLKNKMKIMSEKTIHRGPDAQEIQLLENSAIGMNRLAIVGPDKTNVMVQKDKQIYSVMNGEITNFKELENQNIKCDSEIVLPMFKKYGQEFVKQLGGMFSIAIYNEEENKLYLYRDPLGIKPLYYYKNDEYFIFASEIKAIYSSIDKKPEIDESAIDNILRYTFNPGRKTVFKEIKKVMPGELVTVCNGQVEFEKYWKLKKNKKEKKSLNKIDEFKKILKKVVKENAYSDVPGGFFLSGGLDSSLITAMILENEKNSNYQIPISIKFSPNSVEDEKYTNKLGKFLKKDIQWVEITPQIARETLEEVITYLDEPLENPTHIGTYLMAKKAKELGLKTVITGDGADEFFIGYKRQICWKNCDNPQEKYPSLNWKISKEDIDKLYNDEFKSNIKNKNYIPECVKNIDEALLYERGERLPEYHNMRLDRMTMAHGIEAKVPFEDCRIANYSFCLSIDELTKNMQKGFLKEVAEDWLPKEIIYRKKSIFPSLPDEWIADRGIEWARNILLDDNSRIRKYFNMKTVEEFIKEHSMEIKNRGKELWSIIVLELWLRNVENWN